MMKDSKVHLENSLLIKTCSPSQLLCSRIGLWLECAYSTREDNGSDPKWYLILHVAEKPRNIPKYIANN
jgi:hypothetical protein